MSILLWGHSGNRKWGEERSATSGRGNLVKVNTHRSSKPEAIYLIKIACGYHRGLWFKSLSLLWNFFEGTQKLFYKLEDIG